MHQKKPLILIILFMCMQYVFCQNTFDTEGRLKTNIYFHSLEKYFESVDSSATENHKDYYIATKTFYLDSFPKTINSFNIKWVKKEDIDALLKSSKTDFINLMINPIKIEKGIFSVSIIPFYGHSKLKKYTILKGVYKFQYDYDSQRDGLVYKNLVMD